MAGKDLNIGNLVWAKMKGYPPWPAKIAQPNDGSKSRKSQHYVYFFGTHDFAWILDDHIFPHSEEMLANSKMYKKKSTTMQNAIDEIERKSQKSVKKPKLIAKDQIKKEPLSDKVKKEPLNDKLKKDPSNDKIKKGPIKDKVKKTPLKVKIKKETKDKIKKEKSPQVESIQEKTKTPKRKKYIPKTKIKIDKKSSKKRSAAEMMSNDFDNNAATNLKMDEDSDEDYSLLVANLPPNNGGISNVAVIPPYLRNQDSRPSSAYKFSLFNRPVTPPLVKTTQTRNFDYEFIKANNKKIGFLGIGMIGRQLVQNLMNAGHAVMIWNRTMHAVCDDLVKAGAEKALYPSDVIQACDITFCCVSGPEAAKAVVFGIEGVLAGFDGQSSNKAYVELTTIDPTTSGEIGEAIVSKGGRYLEAPMVGSRKNASENTLVMLAAGDRTLFTECDTCFSSWATNAFYLGCEVGTATKMNLILSNLVGTSYAALGEALALVEKKKLSKPLFLDMLTVGRMSCPLLINKACAMINNDPTVNNPIKHQQKDMEIAVALADSLQQPLPLTVAAKEMFTRAKIQFPEGDVSAVHLIAS